MRLLRSFYSLDARTCRAGKGNADEARSVSLSAMTFFYLSINTCSAKLVFFLLEVIINFVGIPQTLTPCFINALLIYSVQVFFRDRLFVLFYQMHHRIEHAYDP